MLWTSLSFSLGTFFTETKPCILFDLDTCLVRKNDVLERVFSRYSRHSNRKRASYFCVALEQTGNNANFHASNQAARVWLDELLIVTHQRRIHPLVRSLFQQMLIRHSLSSFRLWTPSVPLSKAIFVHYVAHLVDSHHFVDTEKEINLQPISKFEFLPLQGCYVRNFCYRNWWRPKRNN